MHWRKAAAEEEEEAEEVVEEAEGLKLHLNPLAASGYRGVEFMRDGRSRPFRAYSGRVQ